MTVNRKFEKNVVLRGKDDRLNSLALLLILTFMVAFVVACVSMSDDSNGQDAGGIEGGIEWNWDASTNKLTIEATDSPEVGYNKGEMPNYSDEELPQWTSLIVDGSSLVIENGVTRIGNSAFCGCYGFTGDLVIPDTVTYIGSSAFKWCFGFNGELKIGSGVSTIEEKAFLGCSRFTGDLVIPDGMTTIHTSTFEGCSGFNGKLKIGNNVVLIERNAFHICSGFTSDLVIPEKVTKIEGGAFAGCGGKGFILNGNTNFTVNDGILLNKDGDTILACPTGKTGTLTIPKGTTTIDGYAFYLCSGLTGNLVIPDSVMTIGELAFSECSGLTGDLVIPDSVVHIAGYAFCKCSGINGNITIGCGIDEDSASSFFGCGGKGFVLNGNTNFTVKDGILLNKDGNTILVCPTGKTGTLTIPNGITTIETNAFYMCSSLTGDLIIPDGVVHIAEYAFPGCFGFTGDLIIPDSVTFLGDGAFNGCSGIKGNIVIGKGVDTINKNTFINVIPTSITIPSTVTTIDPYAFNSISFYDGTTEITDYSKLPGHTYVRSNESNTKFIQEDIWNVLFVSNGGSKSVKGLHENNGDKFFLPSYDGTKTGYIFVGWSYAGTTYPAGTEITKVNDNMTFVAKWGQYTATFMNGDTVFSQTTYDCGSVIIAPTEIPTKESTAQYDYKFSHWEGFTEGMIITGDITFYAVYDEVPKSSGGDNTMIVIGIIVALAIIGGGIYYYVKVRKH